MTRALLLAVIVLALMDGPAVGAQGRGSGQGGAVAQLAATSHAPLPADRSRFWIVPDGAAPVSTGAGRVARAAALVADQDYADALALLRTADVTGTLLDSYAQYYAGRALAGLNRLDEAQAAFVAARSLSSGGALGEAVPLELADVALARNDARTATGLLGDLSRTPVTAPQDVLLRFGRAAERGGERDRAVDAYRRVYFEYPLAAEADEAGRALVRLGAAVAEGPDDVARALVRAERLFSARRWTDARAAYAPLAIAVAGSERARVEMRLAECDFHLNRHRAAREALQTYATTPGPYQVEAGFFYLSATRGLGSRDEYVRLARALVADHPSDEWAAETLNNLASHYIQAGDDAQADLVFRELLQRHPRSRHAERAAWKAGWRAYLEDDFAAVSQVFEQAAGAFPRADTRPAWLYWSARARDQRNDQTTANTLYRLVVTDYQNSYYGRLAARLLTARREPMPPRSVMLTAAAAAAKPVPTEALIRTLAAAGLYADALREVRYAQQTWGDSTPLQATQAWLRHQQGLTLKATERFEGLRGAITQMRRVYPQFMASGGEQLPPEVLRIIFPLDFWPLIKSHSDAHGLDPYLMAALTAQESTFTAEIRSSANAYGLMQIIPSTGRQYARTLGVRPFSTASLTNPDLNVRIGTQFFKDLLDRFGGAHFALAGYNAGPHRVVRWLAETPGLDDDEFIDNIPFPETQGYVKRILGTAEDYRRLYGPGGPLAPVTGPPAARRTD